MRKHFDIRVFGRVQGVGFRYSAFEKAWSLNLTGVVKNKEDGSVSIEAEGGEENLKEFVDWCKKGSTYSKIEKVEVTESELKDFAQFEIS